MGIGYLFLAVSAVAGATKAYCGKKSSEFIKNETDAVRINFMRMVLCVAFGIIVVAISSRSFSLAVGPSVVWLSFMGGSMTAMFTVCWLLAVRKGALVMVDVFVTAGVMLPLLYSCIVLRESIRLVQWIGFVLLIGSVFLMCSYNNSVKPRLKLSSVILLILCGLCNGLTDLSQKLFAVYGNGVEASVFNFYNYLWAAVVLGLVSFFTRKKSRNPKTEGLLSSGEKTEETFPFRKILPYVSVMAICLFLASYFKTMAASRLPAVLLYPLAQGIALILSAVMAATLFKERMNIKSIAGISLALVAFIMINVL